VSKFFELEDALVQRAGKSEVTYELISVHNFITVEQATGTSYEYYQASNEKAVKRWQV
jgi:hypothetical protein